MTTEFDETRSETKTRLSDTKTGSRYFGFNDDAERKIVSQRQHHCYNYPDLQRESINQLINQNQGCHRLKFCD